MINPSSFIMPHRFYKLCFLLFVFITCTSSSSLSSYEDNCSFIIPESEVTSDAQNVSLPSFKTRYFIEGGKLVLSKKPSEQNQFCYDVGRSLEFPISPRFYKTKTEGVYKIEAQMFMFSPYACFDNDQRNKARRTGRSSSIVNASLTGFWSKNTMMVCMVGSATWDTKGGQVVNLSVVLKMKYPVKNSTLQESFVKGTFESMIGSKDNLQYFDSISIFHFPALPNYEYLSAKNVTAESSDYALKNQSFSLQQGQFCHNFGRSSSLYELWYASGCNLTVNCSPLLGDDNFLPRYVELNPIQCLENGRKIRYMIRFRNTSTEGTSETFGLNSMLIGEATWDNSINQLIIVAYRIPNLSTNVVHDSSRVWFTLRFPSVWNIRDVTKIAGRLWTQKAVNGSGYFPRIELKSFWGNGVGVSEGLRYEYTEMDGVLKVCKAAKIVKEGKHEYPNALSYFRMSFENSEGQSYALGGATPLSIEKTDSKSLTNISYYIEIVPFPFRRGRGGTGKGFPSVNWSMNVHGRMEIIAEGTYDPETGHLCMVGCRMVIAYYPKSSNDTTDCAIQLSFQFASLGDYSRGVVKRSIRSARKKTDPLYFEELVLPSAASVQLA